MGKALIIMNDANFASQAVTKITFSDPTPCTGISFASDTVTITGYDPVTIGYTVTPPDTTDPIVWESSDTSVVTVSGGILTVVGVGTATITATCGRFSASATVTVSISYATNFKFYQLAHGDGKLFLSASYALSRLSASGDGEQAGTQNIVTSSGSDVLYPIKIPKNVTKIKVSIGTVANFYNSSDCSIQWLKDTPCGDTNFPTAALWVSQTAFNPRSDTPITASVPENVDCFAVYFHLASKQAEGTDPNAFATESGVSIEFLTE